MEYYDSTKKPLRRGLYRDRKDKFHILYLFQQDDKWKFQDSNTPDPINFPVVMSTELQPIDEPIVELERFKKVVSFLEKKIDEDIEERRDL